MNSCCMIYYVWLYLQLEVVPVEKSEESHAAAAIKETSLTDCTAPTAQVKGFMHHPCNLKTVIQKSH